MLASSVIAFDLGCPGRGSHHRGTVAAGEAGRLCAEHQGTPLFLRLPDPRISGTHARLELADGRWVIEDLGSLNGTFVNSTSEKRVSLFDRDVIALGHAAFVYRDAVTVPSDSIKVGDRGASLSSLGLATLIPSLDLEFTSLAGAARSRTGLPILLHGPTGVGKEVVANAIHALSARRGRFVAVNCAAISETLAESELFGHRKGAFSGASEERPGLVRSADKGTLFLDEIGDLPLGLQGKLLRRISPKTGAVLAAASHRIDLWLAACFDRWATRHGYVGANPFQDVKPLADSKQVGAQVNERRNRSALVPMDTTEHRRRREITNRILSRAM